MTAEQLEELLELIGSTDDHLHFGAVEKLKEISPSLARRVIAAETLVEAAEKLAEMDEATRAFDDAMDKLADAATAYREASK